jgi:hypothetical protein
MIRLVLLLILFIIIARTFWRVVDNVIEAATGRPPGGGAGRGAAGSAAGVEMVRDPICGTFVVRDRAVSLVDGATRVHFCSDACRDKYRARGLKGRTA